MKKEASSLGYTGGVNKIGFKSRLDCETHRVKIGVGAVKFVER